MEKQILYNHLNKFRYDNSLTKKDLLLLVEIYRKSFIINNLNIETISNVQFLGSVSKYKSDYFKNVEDKNFILTDKGINKITQLYHIINNCKFKNISTYLFEFKG